ncbi:hypothetical protein WJX81_007199 [Elliptochloris bilobata]|uniref:Uncharacterized protein n=1 Tax=Elliptochloris bilobata TaxID=381761 RepID=A0AAW1QY06_9CHLO
MRSGINSVRRLSSGLQPVAEQLGLAPGLVRLQGRCAAVGAFHCYAVPRAADGPSREGASPEDVPGQELDPNRVPPESPPSVDSGASKGHTAPTREDLEHADAGMALPGKEAGPSGRPGDPYTQGKDGIERNAGLGEFPPGDPASSA